MRRHQICRSGFTKVSFGFRTPEDGACGVPDLLGKGNSVDCSDLPFAFFISAPTCRFVGGSGGLILDCGLPLQELRRCSWALPSYRPVDVQGLYVELPFCGDDVRHHVILCQDKRGQDSEWGNHDPEWGGRVDPRADSD